MSEISYDRSTLMTENKALKENLKKPENSSRNKLKNKIKAFC